ncbi:hypothetical protein FHEFKHOI_00142 [Candidatus Methanoperedenaceae archaeon GB50]|nr:hypothetical protein AIOGIFDO_00144 [Candidatus Methanoperedenaceae archaeon GB37]CAD7768198.1 hypothetical protein FHEFKHOI_00142 [Candidatus Methanoperedenaceae archaeon GB50]CAD7779585.1 MAG: hypothetical protein KBONHNOK_01337 [Candidatus Methanoperedenaceae archaeon GB50]
MINVYLPIHSLQGSEIPLYILWERSENIDLIEIEYSEEIEIKEIYNVSEGNFRLKDNILYVDKVDVNGYLGIKFISKLNEPSTKKDVDISIYKNNQIIYSEKKSIILFRPDITLYEAPNHISLEVLGDQNIINISNKIKIANRGRGTAILRLECSDSSDIKIFNPMGIEEFRKNFWDDVERKASKLRVKFPEYNELLVGFVEMGKNPPIFKKDELEKLKILFNGLLNAFEEDEVFLRDFANVILTSYLKNISIVTELESFLIYLRTVYENKIIFMDAINAIKVSTTPMKLSAKLYITDLAYNEYKPIELDNITIKANKEYVIPVYLLFDFTSSEKEGE